MKRSYKDNKYTPRQYSDKSYIEQCKELKYIGKIIVEDSKPCLSLITPIESSNDTTRQRDNDDNDNHNEEDNNMNTVQVTMFKQEDDDDYYKENIIDEIDKEEANGYSINLNEGLMSSNIIPCDYNNSNDPNELIDNAASLDISFSLYESYNKTIKYNNANDVLPQLKHSDYLLQPSGNSNNETQYKLPTIAKAKCYYQIAHTPNANDNDNDTRYQYLHTDFHNDQMDNTWLFNNNKVFLSYQKYLASDTLFEEMLSFGDNPLKPYQRLINKIVNIDKGKGSTTHYNDVNVISFKDKLKSIENYISQLPVLNIPNDDNRDDEDTDTALLKKYCRGNNNKNSNITSNYEGTDNDFYHEELKAQCKICSKRFSSSQGLGGHMSQAHRLQSESFQKRKMIRNHNAVKRMANQTAKKLLCDKYNIDYNTLMKYTKGKRELKQFFKENRKELMLIKRENKNVYMVNNNKD